MNGHMVIVDIVTIECNASYALSITPFTIVTISDVAMVERVYVDSSDFLFECMYITSYK